MQNHFWEMFIQAGFSKFSQTDFAKMSSQFKAMKLTCWQFTWSKNYNPHKEVLNYQGFQLIVTLDRGYDMFKIFKHMWNYNIE